MIKYSPKSVEKKWQTKWQVSKAFVAKENAKKKKKFVLIEFPYPSGAGLHMGHLRPYLAGDIYSRYRRLLGEEVLYPIGWDAFGLPAENFAIKHKVHPSISTKKNIASAKKQLLSWGISFDWSREINTTDPEYYKWTQWIFNQLFDHGLAYEKMGLINWCPSCKTGLANEEVVEGKCERCGAVAEKKELRQWYLKITDYAEKLLAGLRHLDQWPDAVKLQQENWIGKSYGLNITYKIDGTDKEVTVFTTRPDTNFGATFVVVGPEHPLLASKDILNITDENWIKVEKYIKKSISRSDIDRLAEGKKKTGVFTGLYAVNSLNKYKMPIYVADYVLGGVGTGAVVGVPAHDMRDFEFAKEFDLPVVRVVQKDLKDNDDIVDVSQVHDGDGLMTNSDFLNGMSVDNAKEYIADHLTQSGIAKKVIRYRLRDWVFSRQRYWGEPIPLVYCAKCAEDIKSGKIKKSTLSKGEFLNPGFMKVVDKDLPLTLPKVKKYQPTGTGESPLAEIKSFVNTKCPRCKGAAKRETNTMPQWAGSSWYWLRYADPKNKKAFADEKKLKFWQPVDVYFGGMEHTTLHLLYSRFWNQFLYDIKKVKNSEPYTRRVPHGIVLASDGEKMSKSKGNVVDPAVVSKDWGVDTMRMYMMFLGPHGDQVAWSDKGIVGIKRFLDRVWAWGQEIDKKTKDNKEVEASLHKLFDKTAQNLDNFRFNLVVSSLMEFINFAKDKDISARQYLSFLSIVSLYAPHICDEIAEKFFGKKMFIKNSSWLKVNKKLLQEEKIKLVVQVNGKTKTVIELSPDHTQEEVENLTRNLEQVKPFALNIVKVIFVPNRIINFVVKQ